MIPYIQRLPLKLDRIAVCWDGSQFAARALADAAPLLTHAKHIELLTVSDLADSGRVPGADIATHMARHGLNTTVRNLSASDIDAGNAILSYTADTKIDMLVMGGYGHSRVRELVLGGVTQTMLDSMTLPVLLAH